MASYTAKKLKFTVGDDTYEMDPQLDVAEAIAGKLDKTSVENVLTETNEGYALDARQGKALKDLIDSLTKISIWRGSDVCTAANGATLDTSTSYTRAFKRAGIAIVEIRITCPTIPSSSDPVKIATLTGALAPYADTMYLKTYDMWGTAVNGIVSIRNNGNIEAMSGCSGKNIQIIATYPCSQL